MFAKGPVAGATFKDDALKLLPQGTACRRLSAAGMTGYVIELPGGRQIASAGNSGQAWRNALDWASRNQVKSKAEE